MELKVGTALSFFNVLIVELSSCEDGPFIRPITIFVLHMNGTTEEDQVHQPFQTATIEKYGIKVDMLFNGRPSPWLHSFLLSLSLFNFG